MRNVKELSKEIDMVTTNDLNILETAEQIGFPLNRKQRRALKKSRRKKSPQQVTNP